MEEIERDIIDGALRLFLKFGIRSVTMDDVAGELGMSKKTIYKHFKNKAELVHRGVQTVYQEMQSKLLEIHSHMENPIDELMAITALMQGLLEQHSHNLRFQLQKYYPQTFQELYEGRHELISKVMRENIERGKAHGLFREDANADVLAQLYCSKLDKLPEQNEDLMKRHGIAELMRQSMEYHVRGLATPKGIQYLEEKLNKGDK